MTAAAEKVLVIGLDMGDGRLIGEWARGGSLPALAALIRNGRAEPLETTADRLHVSGWPSLYTGTHPGEHGVYYTFQPAPRHQGWLKFQGDQYGRPTFWALLAGTGVRCSVLDAPYTHPEPGSAAAQVIDWGSWAPYWKPSSTPADLRERLQRACGRYPLGFHALDVGMNRMDPAELSRKLVPAAQAKTRAALWLMDERPWDLFLTVYGESHAAAHYCWGDEGSLQAVYQEIDRGIGALVERVGPGVSVYVVSGDGVGPNHAGWHLLPEVLRRLGQLAEPGPQQDGQEAGRGRSLDPVKLVRDLLPKDLRKAIARKLLPDALRHKLAQRVDTAGIDWTRTRAYCLPTDLEGYIRINLRGREPQGCVAPGEEYGRLCDTLIEELERLTDPATGNKVVRAVVRTDEAYPGPKRDFLPDLIVLWHGDAPITAVASPAIGTVSGASPDGRPGTHVPPGYLIRHGPAARVGRASHVSELAPELLRRFGATVPDYMGRAPAGAPAAPDGGGS